MPDLEILVGDRVFTGWKSIQFTRSMESAASSFSAQFADTWSVDDRPFPFTEGQRVRLLIDRTVVLDGYIDDCEPRYTARDHSITIKGRSKPGQLVDCSAVHKTGKWRNVTLKTIAEDITAPFGISVTFDDAASADPKINERFRKFALQEGESAYEALERAARLRGLLMVSDRGALVFTKATTTDRVPMPIQGRRPPVLTAARLGRFTERFSDYLVLGQSTGDDQWFGEAAARGFASAQDDEIGIYRPLVIIESNGGKPVLQRRADWERNVRAGRARRVAYTLQGWEHPGGVWEPNRLVSVDDEWLGISGEFLIASVTLLYGDQGRRTGLELTDRAAFDVLSKVRRKGSSWL